MSLYFVFILLTSCIIYPPFQFVSFVPSIFFFLLKLYSSGPSPSTFTMSIPARTFRAIARPATRQLRPATSFPVSAIQSRLHSTNKHPQGFEAPAAEELDELRERVQEFTRREVSEEVAAHTDKTNAFPNDMWKKLGDAGLLGITADVDVGGLGMGYQAHCVVMEELSRASGSIGLSYAAHSQLCVNQVQPRLNGADGAGWRRHCRPCRCRAGGSLEQLIGHEDAS